MARPLVSDVSLVIGKRFWGVGAIALLFVEKNGQAAKEREVARASGFMDLATILVLRAIPAMMLAVFNRPVIAIKLEMALRGASSAERVLKPKTISFCVLMTFFQRVRLIAL